MQLAELALQEKSFEACEHDYTKIMHYYAKQNKLQEAENIFFAMKEKGFIGSVRVFVWEMRFDSV